MKLDVRKMISDPFWFAMYMLLIAYLGAPVFLEDSSWNFQKSRSGMGSGFACHLFDKKLQSLSGK